MLHFLSGLALTGLTIFCVVIIVHAVALMLLLIPGGIFVLTARVYLELTQPQRETPDPPELMNSLVMLDSVRED